MNIILNKLLEEHKGYLSLMGDIAGHSISDTAWIKVRSYLSPNHKFILIDPIMITPNLLLDTEIILNKHIEFSARGQIKIYLKYIFIEPAACFEFLLQGAPLQMPYSFSEPFIEHCLVRDPDDQNKIMGIISIFRKSCIDNTYTEISSYFQQTKINKNIC